MSRIGPEHEPVCGATGKCSVPMWSSGSPDGFCDRPAYGQQYTGRWYTGAAPKPYATGMCCDWHGGPSATSNVRFCRDGNQWCAFRPGFENLQENDAGFGPTQDDAYIDLLRVEALPKRHCDDCGFETTRPDVTVCPDKGCRGSVG